MFGVKPMDLEAKCSQLKKCVINRESICQCQCQCQCQIPEGRATFQAYCDGQKV